LVRHGRNTWPHYRSDLGWILGVAFLGTLTPGDQPRSLRDDPISVAALAALKCDQFTGTPATTK
jgi:hypothetical protein